MLHTKQFLEDCRRLLTDGGVFVTQNGVPFQHPDHLARTTKTLGQIYRHVAPYVCTQPCYFGGEFALNWASDSDQHLHVDTATLARRAKRRDVSTRYWTPALHNGAFALPAFMEEIVDKALAKAKPAAKTKGKSKRTASVDT